MEHLCKTCRESFVECNGNPVFSIERVPSLGDVEVDMVIECDQYNGPDPARIDKTSNDYICLNNLMDLKSGM